MKTDTFVEDPDVLLIHPPYHRRAGSGVVPPIGLAYLASSLREKGRKVILGLHPKKRTTGKVNSWRMGR